MTDAFLKIRYIFKNNLKPNLARTIDVFCTFDTMITKHFIESDCFNYVFRIDVPV